MATWIDFKELRQRLSFEAVLRHYGVELKLKGKQHHGFCPLPGHQGKKNSASFSANLERGIFQCFGCGATGNIIEFAARMEGLDPSKGEDFRKAALLLNERFGGTSKPATPEPEKPVAKKESPAAQTLPVVINAPLDFELQGLDASHPYLTQRGLEPGTIMHFGLGFCARGTMAGRIAIPLNDQRGNLIGYAGRIVDETAVNADNPKYKLPGARERDGGRYEFHKGHFLYNGFRIPWPTDDLIIVEGFPAVWWLYQAGFASVAGLMGADCSEEQARIITESAGREGRVWIVPDGDDAGVRCAHSVLIKVASHCFCRWVKLDPGKQPTDYSREELTALLTLTGTKRGAE